MKSVRYVLLLNFLRLTVRLLEAPKATLRGLRQANTLSQGVSS